MAKPRLGPGNPLTSNPLTAALTVAGPAPRTTVSLSLEVAERARDAAHELRLPLVALVETAIREHVERLERERGVPIPERPQRRRRRR
jgi:hypothetical protein